MQIGGIGTFFEKVSEWVLSFIGGVLASLVVFRIKIFGLEKDLKAEEDARKSDVTDLVKQHEELEREIRGRLNQIDKRQIITLELLADIARAANLDKRASDAFVRFLQQGTRDD